MSREFCVICAAVALVAFIVYAFVFGDGGYLQLYRMRGRILQLQEEIASLERENAELRDRLRFIRNNSSYIEEIAVRDLGLQREGEVIYDFIVGEGE
ncbi:MAG: FtsB family cell division protein [bacterium]